MNALSYIRLVLWSFFGVRRGAAASDELAKARPVPLLVTAVALGAAFAGLLLWLALYAAEAFG